MTEKKTGYISPEAASEIASRLFKGATIDLTIRADRPIPDDPRWEGLPDASDFTPEIPFRMVQAVVGDVPPSKDEINQIVDDGVSYDIVSILGDIDLIEEFKAGVASLLMECINKRLDSKKQDATARAIERSEAIMSMTTKSREMLTRFAQGEDFTIEPNEIKKALIAEGKESPDFNPFEGIAAPKVLDL
jgi:hypothetical protein